MVSPRPRLLEIASGTGRVGRGSPMESSCLVASLRTWVTRPPRIWDVVKSDLPPATRKATLLRFDEVLGLGLAEWAPVEDAVPDAVMELVEARQRARSEKRWKDADALRGQVADAGYEIEDTANGPRVKRRTGSS